MNTHKALHLLLLAASLALVGCADSTAHSREAHADESRWYNTWGEYCQNKIGAICRLRSRTVGVIVGAEDGPAYRQSEDDPHASFELQKVDLPLGLYVDFLHHDRDGWACFEIHTQAIADGNDARGSWLAEIEGKNFCDDRTYVLIRVSDVEFVEKDWSELPEYF